MEEEDLKHEYSNHEKFFCIHNWKQLRNDFVDPKLFKQELETVWTIWFFCSKCLHVTYIYNELGDRYS